MTPIANRYCKPRQAPRLNVVRTRSYHFAGYLIACCGVCSYSVPGQFHCHLQYRCWNSDSISELHSIRPPPIGLVRATACFCSRKRSTYYSNMGTEVSLQSSDGGDHGRRKNDCKIAPSRLLVVIGSLIFGTFTLYEGMPSVQQNVEMHIRGQNGPKRPTYQQYARRLEAKDWNFDAEDTKWMQQHYRPYTAKKLFVGSAVNDPQFHFKSQLHNFGDHGLNMQLFGWSSEGTGSSFATDKLNGVRKLLDTLAEDTLVLLVDIGENSNQLRGVALVGAIGCPSRGPRCTHPSFHCFSLSRLLVRPQVTSSLLRTRRLSCVASCR